MRARTLLKWPLWAILRSAHSWQVVVFRDAPVDLCFSDLTNPSSNVALTHALKGQDKDFMPSVNRRKIGHC